MKNAIELAKSIAIGAGVGGILGAFAQGKQTESYSQKEHLTFLIRLNHTTKLVSQIIADAYQEVKESGGPASFDLETMKSYQKEARRIWTSEVTFIEPPDPADDDSMLH